ncbi:MAG TPA: superinfection immunity protein, partial [Verrucomicrobiae bacterium]|nr:superinfection immunity protein [Verrucomicrobiae bacterium]
APNLVGVFLVNFLLGWSIIGWILALVWAVSTTGFNPARPPQAWSSPPPRAGLCPNCGSQGQTGRFCSHCGAALS